MRRSSELRLVVSRDADPCFRSHHGTRLLNFQILLSDVYATSTAEPGDIRAVVYEEIHTGGTGVRVDSAAYTGALIPPYYDSLVAKLIVKGRDRGEAIGRMKRALEMFVIEGIKTSIPLQRRIMADPDFASGKFDTHFIEKLVNTNGK